MVLQKLFSAFPGGAPGVGLLLLRVFIALTLTVQGLTYIRSPEWIISVPCFACALCLLIGFVTPIVAVITGLGAIAFTMFYPTLAGNSILSVIILAAAIALLGPGAFSLDARLFGRREILIPSTRSSK